MCIRDSPNTTVGFNKDVTLENGIYFNESFPEEAEVEQLLSGVQLSLIHI